MPDVRPAGTPLEPGETWCYTCRRCSVTTQGGWPAFDRHLAVVHPDLEEAEDQA